jgi:hypothetical protein
MGLSLGYNQIVSKRMVEKQQMGWSPRGAHLLLLIRTRVLGEQWENAFRRWYPAFRAEGQSPRKRPAPGISCSPVNGHSLRFKYSATATASMSSIGSWSVDAGCRHLH